MSSIMSDVFLIGGCITGSVILGVIVGIMSYVHLRRNPYPEDGDIEGYCNKILESMHSPEEFASDLTPSQVTELKLCAALYQFCRSDCHRQVCPETVLVTEENGMCVGDTATKEKVLKLEVAQEQPSRHLYDG